jgi:hypothetical protein
METVGDYLKKQREAKNVGLQMVLDKSGMKLREGFYLPYILFQMFMQSLKSNYVFCVSTSCFS